MVNSMRNTISTNFLSEEGEVPVPYSFSAIIWSLPETNSSYLCKKWVMSK